MLQIIFDNAVFAEKKSNLYICWSGQMTTKYYFDHFNRISSNVSNHTSVRASFLQQMTEVKSLLLDKNERKYYFACSFVK